MILQSWFKKSLDTCVLGGDTECQVPQSCFDLFPPENSFLLLSINNKHWRKDYNLQFCGNLPFIGAAFSDSLSLFWLFSSFPRLVLAFRNFSWVTFVGQAGSRYLLYPIKKIIFKHSFQAMLGPIQQNWAANGQVQHWNKVRFWGQVDLINSPVVIFRYAVVGVMEELKTSLAVLQVHNVLALAGSSYISYGI